MAKADVESQQWDDQHTLVMDSKRQPVTIGKRLAQSAAALPSEERAKLPSDSAEQHDHYIYGKPKRQP